jgi:hypothetical protein
MPGVSLEDDPDDLLTTDAEGPVMGEETMTTAVTESEQPAGTDPSVAEEPVKLSGGHAVLRYTTLRLALFLGALVLIWGIARVFNMDLSSQLSRLTLLAVAVLASSSASFLLLSKQRDAMSAGLVARSERLSRKFTAASSFEDE